MPAPSSTSDATPARRGLVRRFIADPLTQFLFIGIGVFALNNALSEPQPQGAEDEIIVTAAQGELLVQQFRSAWSRTPTEVERAGLIEDHIRDEVLYREALSLGLDTNDSVIRMRLRQKMEFLADSAGAELSPDDATLRAYLEANLSRYVEPGSVTLEQILLPDDDGAAEAVLAALAAGQNAEMIGEVTTIPFRWDDISASALDSNFGPGVFDEVATLPIGTWAGPVRSAYGQHLIRVVRLQLPAPPDFAAVRDEVLFDWTQEQATQRQDEQYAALRDRYAITIEAAP